MPTYEHDGLCLAYHEGDAGVPVLLTPGTTGTGQHEWGQLASALSARYRCIAPDLRGHSQYMFGSAAITADLRALIRHLDSGRPHVAGFSYGPGAVSRMDPASSPSSRRARRWTPNCRRVFARAGCPVLLLSGDYDTPARRSRGQRFAAARSRARYAEIAGAGRAAQLDQPAEVARVVATLLTEVDNTPGPVPTSATTDQGN